MLANYEIKSQWYKQCSGLHDPINDQNENGMATDGTHAECRSSLRGSLTAGQLKNLETHILVGGSDENDNFFRDSIIPQ